MRRLGTGVVLATTGTCLTILAAMAHSGATGIVKTRMEAMKSVASDMKLVGSMIKGDTALDGPVVMRAAQSIAEHARAIPDQFPEGSTEKPSEAMPVIWSQWDRFVALADDMATQADQLASVAGSSSDATAIKAAFGDLSRTCSACHEDFRMRR